MVGQEKANRKRELTRSQQKERNIDDENDATLRCIDFDMKEDGYSKMLLLSKQDQVHIQDNCFIKNIQSFNCHEMRKDTMSDQDELHYRLFRTNTNWHNQNKDDNTNLKNYKLKNGHDFNMSFAALTKKLDRRCYTKSSLHTINILGAGQPHNYDHEFRIQTHTVKLRLSISSRTNCFEKKQRQETKLAVLRRRESNCHKLFEDYVTLCVLF